MDIATPRMGVSLSVLAGEAAEAAVATAIKDILRRVIVLSYSDDTARSKGLHKPGRANDGVTIHPFQRFNRDFPNTIVELVYRAF